MNSVQSFVFPQSRFLSSCAAAGRFWDVKAGALLRVHGPLAIMVLSYLLPPAQAVPLHFCQAAVRMYPKNLCKAGGHGETRKLKISLDNPPSSVYTAHCEQCSC